MSTTYERASGTTGTVHLEWTMCIFCGTVIAMVDDMYRRRKKDGQTFYCPNGHGQVFVMGESRAAKFKRLMEAERVCAEDGCATILSIYNRDKKGRCSIHEQPNHNVGAHLAGAQAQRHRRERREARAYQPKDQMDACPAIRVTI